MVKWWQGTFTNFQAIETEPWRRRRLTYILVVNRFQTNLLPSWKLNFNCVKTPLGIEYNNGLLEVATSSEECGCFGSCVVCGEMKLSKRVWRQINF